MGTKTKPIDRRVLRTRRLLRDALVALILERGWDEVSVQDVCARADVGRSTFYAHFADKEELLISGFDALAESLHERRQVAVGRFAFAEHLIAHAKENQRLFRALLGKKSGKVVQDRFRHVVLEVVDAELEGTDLEGARRAAVARFVAGGFVELLLGWLDRPGSVAPAELAELFLALARGALAGAKRGASKD